MKKKIDNIRRFAENFIILEITGNDEYDNKMIEKMAISMSRRMCSGKTTTAQETYRELISRQLVDKRIQVMSDNDRIVYLRINGSNDDPSNFIDIFLIYRNFVRNNMFLMSSINTKKLSDAIYRVCYELTNRYGNESIISIAVKKNIFCKNNIDALSDNWIVVKNVFSAMEYAFKYKIEFIIYDTSKNKHAVIEDLKATKVDDNTLDYAQIDVSNVQAKSYEQSVVHIANILGFGSKIVNSDTLVASDIPTNLLNFGELMCEIILPNATVPAILSGAINALYRIRVDCTSLQVDAIPVSRIIDKDDNRTFYVETTVEHPDAYLYVLNPKEFCDEDIFNLSDELKLQHGGLFINHDQIKIKISEDDFHTVAGIKHLKILSIIHADFPTRQRIPKSIDDELYIRNMLNEYMISSSNELAYLTPTNVVLNGYEVMIMGLKYYKLHSSNPKIKNQINDYKFHLNFIVRKYDKSDNRFLFTPIDINGILPTKWLEYPETQVVMSFNKMIDTSKSFLLEQNHVPSMNGTVPQFDIELREIDGMKTRYCKDLSGLKPTIINMGGTVVIVVGAVYYDNNKISCDNIIKSTNSLCGITKIVTAIYSVTDGGEDYIFNAIEINGERVWAVLFEPPRLSQVIVFNDTVDTLRHISSLSKTIFNKEDNKA